MLAMTATVVNTHADIFKKANGKGGVMPTAGR